MSVRFAYCGGKRAARFLPQAARTALIFSAVILAPLYSRADSAGAILKKMVDTYANATAYTGTIVTRSKGKAKDGKDFTLVKSQAIKYKSPNLVTSVVSYQGTGEMAGKVVQGDQTIVGDGKMMTAYWPSKKQYVKKAYPARVTVPDLVDILKRIPTKDAPNLKLLAADTVGGRAVNVVEIRPMMPPNLTPEQQKKWKDTAAKMNPWVFYIDKQNSALLRISASSTSGTVDLRLDDQLFNSSIPASVFTYIPPAGAKEIQAPTPPSLGGAPPGAPGARQGLNPPLPPAHK